MPRINVIVPRDTEPTEDPIKDLDNKKQAINRAIEKLAGFVPGIEARNEDKFAGPLLVVLEVTDEQRDAVQKCLAANPSIGRLMPDVYEKVTY